MASRCTVTTRAPLLNQRNQGPTRNPSIYSGDFISSGRLFREEVIIEKIPTEDNLADSLTKGQTQPNHDRHTREYDVQIHTS